MIVGRSDERCGERREHYYFLPGEAPPLRPRATNLNCVCSSLHGSDDAPEPRSRRLPGDVKAGRIVETSNKGKCQLLFQRMKKRVITPFWMRDVGCYRGKSTGLGNCPSVF